MDFVNGQLRATDVAGVYVNGALVNGHLTNQRQELLDAIRGAEPAFETSESRTRALMEFPRVESLLEAAQIDGGDRLRRSPTRARARAAATRRGSARRKGGREFVEDKLQRKARLFLDQSRRAASVTMQSIGYVVRNLSGLEGRKTLVLLSEGFFMRTMRGARCRCWPARPRAPA